jgi:hypothetical protein
MVSSNLDRGREAQRGGNLLYPSERFRGVNRRLAASLVAVHRSGLRLDSYFKEGPFVSFRDRAEESSLFRVGLEAAADHLTQIGVEAIPPDRYVLYDPEGNDGLGFHSRFATGFRYLDLVGHAVLMRPPALSPELCAADAIRSYIHDSLHNATFRSFRIGSSGEVYREQYGVNFRREDGISYSAPTLSGTRGINLNLLMDGVVTLKTAEAFTEGMLARFLVPRKPADEAMAADITCRRDGLPKDNPAAAFHELVVVPTRRFLADHGIEETGVDLIFEAMRSGRTREFVRRIEASCQQSWREMFLSPSYRRERGERRGGA